MEDRYGKHGTIICSQLQVKKWYDYLNGPTLADPIMDRFLHKVHLFELKGKA